METFEKHLLKSLTDSSWIMEYAAKMGQDNLFRYKNEVYKLLYNLKVGESITISKWVKPENLDLFIKTACCFISESKGCYMFYKNYTIIKHTFDAQQMEKTSALLAKKRWEANNGTDGQGTGSNTVRTSLIPAQKETV
jgi:hypothetical protein